MAGDTNLVTATMIVLITLIVSGVLLTVMSPLIDKADYEIGKLDLRGFPSAAKVFHMVHDYYFYVIIALNIMLWIWYLKLAFAVHTYTREWNP